MSRSIRRRFSVDTSFTPRRYLSMMGPSLGSRRSASGGGGDHQPTGDVLRQPHDLIGEAGNVLLARIGQQ